jgi:hypothetical protein
VIDAEQPREASGEPRACRLKLACSIWAGVEARTLIRRDLGDYLPADTLRDVLLVVTELLTQAYERGCVEVDVAIVIIDTEIIGELMGDRHAFTSVMSEDRRVRFGLMRRLLSRLDPTPNDDGVSFTMPATCPV